MVIRVASLMIVLMGLASLLGCDTSGGPGSEEPFSLKVRVENNDGDPIEGAEVGVRLCYGIECGGQSVSARAELRSKEVELRSFSASVEDVNDVVLEWETASENKNSEFRVERRANSSSFEQLGFVEGTGTTTQPQAYRYRDTDLEPGGYSYRLVAVETDGDEMPSDPVSVEVEGVEVTEIDPVFPNPFSTQTTLVIKSADDSEIQATAHLLSGKQVAVIVDQEVRSGRYSLRWPQQESQLADGLYEIRSQVLVSGVAVARDTAHTIYADGPGNAAPIGVTSSEGTVSTTEKARFPGLYIVGSIDLRDENGNDRGGISPVPETVQFVVTTDAGLHTFDRRVSKETSELTLTVSP